MEEVGDVLEMVVLERDKCCSEMSSAAKICLFRNDSWPSMHFEQWLILTTQAYMNIQTFLTFTKCILQK